MRVGLRRRLLGPVRNQQVSDRSATFARRPAQRRSHALERATVGVEFTAEVARPTERQNVGYGNAFEEQV